ncbi:TetR/AcrR family transcriptional regulator [Nocardioides piscis]|uniref:TetR/AcrR family transcriptional regulator n=1 Tax=Nocardioides piscis TaxID=2714938 RepID=A0A6G7YJW1_9ACTN|nr:TetR/AcrR family transcriptional regulator [Nocardioides piscis]QIK77029.1 TetR/AcrR family transcriptional regulator [Nocardioides piscis]
MPELLPLLDEPSPERADASRNRQAILAAALRLVQAHGVEEVTMDAVASAAGVGKGTLFRRFASREGLMAAVLNQSEIEWQTSVISGPPPLGPGAPALARLLAFGHSRLRLNLDHGALIRAAGASGARSVAAASFASMHVRHLLGELGVRGDLPLLASSLLAPLEVPIVEQQVHGEQMGLERISAGWDDLVRRVVRAD